MDLHHFQALCILQVIEHRGYRKSMRMRLLTDVHVSLHVSTCSHSLSVEHSLVFYSALFQEFSQLAGIHDFLLPLPHSL